MNKAFKQIKINGVTVVPGFDWSSDFRRSYGTYFRNVPQISDAAGTYIDHMMRQTGKTRGEIQARVDAMNELAKRPNVLGAIHLVKSEIHSTPETTVYRKVPAFNMIKAAVR